MSMLHPVLQFIMALIFIFLQLMIARIDYILDICKSNFGRFFIQVQFLVVNLSFEIIR